MAQACARSEAQNIPRPLWNNRGSPDKVNFENCRVTENLADRDSLVRYSLFAKSLRWNIFAISFRRNFFGLCKGASWKNTDRKVANFFVLENVF